MRESVGVKVNHIRHDDMSFSLSALTMFREDRGWILGGQEIKTDNAIVRLNELGDNELKVTIISVEDNGGGLSLVESYIKDCSLSLDPIPCKLIAREVNVKSRGCIRSKSYIGCELIKYETSSQRHSYAPPITTLDVIFKYNTITKI